MGDLISREALIESVKTWDMQDLYLPTHFIDLIEAEPSVTDTNVGGKWIPCSERLPEEDKMSEYYESVIVTLDNGRVTNGCYRNMDEEWWVDAKDGEKHSMNATGHVIAWMPLPPEYKGE